MSEEKTIKKITLRERRKAQPKAVLYFSPEEKKTIKNTIAKTLDESQFTIFMYTCQALGLNPLLNEVACVTYKDKETQQRTMSIQVMRDGFLTIAHRSGKFAGLKSGVNVGDDGKIISGWAEVFHKDFTVPVYQEADFEEYNTGRNLWLTKPKTMIKKVAESMALRKAFNVNGVYSPEEFDKELEIASTPSKLLELEDGDKEATSEQIATIKALKGEIKERMTKQEAVNVISELAKKK
jgi:phage recombination protein Bet